MDWLPENGTGLGILETCAQHRLKFKKDEAVAIEVALGTLILSLDGKCDKLQTQLDSEKEDDDQDHMHDEGEDDEENGPEVGRQDDVYIEPSDTQARAERSSAAGAAVRAASEAAVSPTLALSLEEKMEARLSAMENMMNKLGQSILCMQSAQQGLVPPVPPSAGSLPMSERSLSAHVQMRNEV